MKTFICIKQAIDWNASTKDLRIDPISNVATLSFARYCIDQFDEIALEVGLQYREKNGGELHAITLGAADSDDVLRRALAMHADHAVFVDRGNSMASTAEALAASIRRYGGGIVLCGRTSSMNGTGQTGPAIAELLSMPFVANVIRIEGAVNDWFCHCETSGGYEVFRVTRPFVATVTNAESNLPRVTSIKDAMRAHRSKIETIKIESVLDESTLVHQQHTRVLRRYIPNVSRSCLIVPGAPHEQVEVLAQYIRKVSAQA